MQIPSEPIEQLATRFDYAEREARFLWLVAIFSGHFTRPQYRRFTQLPPGRVDDALVSRLLTNGHATAYSWSAITHKGGSTLAQRIHLTHKAVYSAFGCPDSQHRRAAALGLITQRLQGLDYIIDHWQSEDFLIGEAGRVSYFTDTHHIDPALFPARVYPARNGQGRPVYFPDRFPISVAADGTITFVYLDEPHSTLAPFHSHILRYRPLLMALTAPVRCVYVSARENKRDSAEAVFTSAITADTEEQTTQVEADFLRFCQLQDKWLRKDFAGFSAANHIDRSMLEQRFSSPQHRSRFDAWRQSGAEHTTEPAPASPQQQPNSPPLARPPAFSTFIPQSVL